MGFVVLFILLQKGYIFRRGYGGPCGKRRNLRFCLVDLIVPTRYDCPCVGSVNRGYIVKAVRFFTSATLIFAFNASAIAATVIPTQGPLQVNSGSGFHPVSGPVQLQPGGSVMAGPGGSGEILYSDGCRIPVRPGALSIVAPVSPCAQGQAYPGDARGDWVDNYLPYPFLAGIGVGIACSIWCRENNTVVVTTPVSP
jgi:hypothetical protein